jgi:hypothetical protein
MNFFAEQQELCCIYFLIFGLLVFGLFWFWIRISVVDTDLDPVGSSQNFLAGKVIF